MRITDIIHCTEKGPYLLTMVEMIMDRIGVTIYTRTVWMAYLSECKDPRF